MNERLRVAAYAVCVRDGQLLLARGTADDGTKEWTLPGGGMDHGEDPLDTVVREVEEETGYLAEMTALLGVDSIRRRRSGRLGRGTDFQGLRILYEGRITGGDLRPEVGGSTDLAAWHPLDAVPSLVRVGVVDIGLRLWRERPAAGRLTHNG
ncbi:NUDIX domain-containing protein [Streptomyces sp. WAC05374]|uniref:NUDIX hydrolase n=1 Tax=Streptomyces sp. WAC05374 TaxID=2487420 RepID=UPI000F88F828|nr:NUDIX hydrolase [Streptomyces sp. WAC05374]RST18099.1 NUDIX domain-containing protein [Streptomyces sp. WAC05374]TDF45400.1 NUDIX domain-containing protein [Streptomyces sp. WAC05374]TDF55612.1 NUDIX domain-containing protein [Streptomyces sp. WAC05374]TDF58750.1 NUDIX domain-containing protein [Streptomyces sp. WAC05374]